MGACGSVDAQPKSPPAAAKAAPAPAAAAPKPTPAPIKPKDEPKKDEEPKAVAPIETAESEAKTAEDYDGTSRRLSRALEVSPKEDPRRMSNAGANVEALAAASNAVNDRTKTPPPVDDSMFDPDPNGIPFTNKPVEGGDGHCGGRLVTWDDPCALPEHLYYIFNMHPVLRPGLKQFLEALLAEKEAGKIKGIYIYTANTSLEWVRFVMTCMIGYLELPEDIFAGIKHAPGGLKIVPENAVLYDDHPENVTGNCVAVDPYHNEIPWDILEPVVLKLPDDGNGGLVQYIEKDKQYADIPHEVESEATLAELAEEAKDEVKDEVIEEVHLDMDETLIAGARMSAYFFAINHFLKLHHSKKEQDEN